MLDKITKPAIQKILSPIVDQIIEKDITSLYISGACLIAGLLCAFMSGMQIYAVALLFMILFILLDQIFEAHCTKTGARAQTKVLGRIAFIMIFGAIAFMMGMGQDQSLGAAFVLFSFMILQSAKGLKATKTQGFSLGALIGKSEALIYVLLILLFPAAFSALSFFFGLICWITTSAALYEHITLSNEKEKPTDLAG